MSGERPDSDRSPGTEGTVCPFCAVGCRLDRDGDRVVGRSGPANPDGRLCRKGLRAFDVAERDDRLASPMVREGGELEGTSWADAIERVADGFQTVLDAHGPDALAFLGAPRCTNEENYLLQKLARSLGTNAVDNRARLCHTETARVLESRLGWPATTNSVADLREADVFLVVGANPAERQPVAFDAAVRPAVNDGATLVHVDPHANETTRLATRHLAPRPGTDALVVSLLCALVAETDGVDRSFVASRTTGFEAFDSWLGGLDVGAGAETAGVAVDALEDLAATVADADRVAVLTGTGADDTATANALVDLLLLTGNLGRDGTGFHVLRGLNNEQGAVDAGSVPDRLPGHRPITDPAAREVVAEVWGFDPPDSPGLTEYEMLPAFGESLHAALVVGENPAVSKRDSDLIVEKLDSLDLLVVNDLFPSETTEYADVVLPAAAGVEKSGTVTNLDRQVQRLDPRVEPPGDAKTDFVILRSLARALGIDGCDFDGPAEAFGELAQVTPPYAALDYDALGERSRRWPATGDGEGDRDDAVLYRDSFETADGRAAFETVDLPRADDTGPDDLQLVVGDRAGRFTDDEGAVVDQRLTIHPDDAAALDIGEGDPVVVTTDGARVDTTAHASTAVRPGTVYLHASVGDPLVRSHGSTVDVRRRD